MQLLPAVSGVTLNCASNWTYEWGYFSDGFPLRSQPGHHETVRTCDCKTLMQHFRIQLFIFVWIVDVPIVATFNNLILRAQTDTVIVPRGLDVVHSNDLTDHWSRTNLHPNVSAIIHSVAFLRSSAVLTCGGIRPAATTLRSLIRKLKVAHAFG